MGLSGSPSVGRIVDVGVVVSMDLGLHMGVGLVLSMGLGPSVRLVCLWV